MSNPATAITPEAFFGEVRKNWGWLLALGVVQFDDLDVAGFCSRLAGLHAPRKT